MLDRIVILGGGCAAAQAVDTLRRRGFKGSVLVVGDEPSLPYQRPPLSKKYLAGDLERDRLLIRRDQYYTEHCVEMRLGRRALEIDRRSQRVRLDDGSHPAYDALLVATGSRPRPLSVPGSELEGVRYLRTIADVDALRLGLAAAGRIVIVGGGYIGLEVAATCRQLGLEVTVLEAAERVMKRVVCKEISAFYEAEHVRRGVRIVCGAQVSAIIPHADTRRVRSVLCEDGSGHAADLVLMSVGVAPADEIAVAAGLHCSNGIVVNEHAVTSDHQIYSAGDCANHPSLRYSSRVRLESVDNAFEQATCAALNMLGQSAVHDKVPWFWSDQFDLKLIIVGLSNGYDTTVRRGNPAERSFSVCYLKHGELVAVDAVNSPRDQMNARKLVGTGFRPSTDKLTDPTIALKDCM